MKAVEFSGQTGVAGGKGYEELPFAYFKEENAFVTTWEFSEEELQEMIKNNRRFQVALLYNPENSVVPMLVEVNILNTQTNES